jgi:cancer susceptibility candidate protein 1
MSGDPKPQETLITDVPDAQPLTDALAVSAKAKGKAKKKKMSRKEKARLRKERAEQERLEQLRIEKELEEKRIHEQEQEMERREQERLNQENADLTQLRERRYTQGKAIRAERAQSNDWKRYVGCDHAANPTDQRDVNAFVSLWKDVGDTDMVQLFGQIERASKLLDQLTELRFRAEVAIDADEYERFSNHMSDIRRLIHTKIERLTSYQLLFCEKFASAKNEVLLSNEGGGYGYGLWVNLAKNPKILSIDFKFCGMEVYKTVAQAALAIRCILSPFLSEFRNYLLLSSVLACEFYQLPPPPKRITALTLRQVSTQQNLQTVPYPLKTAKQSEVQPPLIFKMKVDPSTLPDNLDALTVIKIDDIENTQTQISNVEIDRETNILKFSSKTTGRFALALGKYAHFPLQFWEITSRREDSSEIFVRTALTELTLEIDKDGLCSMETVVPFSKLTAPAALEYLQRHGINLVAPDHVDQFGENASKVNEKTAELEQVMASGIADAATGFKLRCSKWNAVLAEDRAMFLACEIIDFGDAATDDERATEEEETPAAAESSPEEEAQREKKPKKPEQPWHALLAKAKHIVEVGYAENADEADLKMKDSTAFHQHLMLMLMDIASSAVRGRTRNASGFVSETLSYILRKVKLFSTTA